MKVDGLGTKVWDRAFGGSADDFLQALAELPDGGMAIGGISSSGIGGEKTEASRGLSDYWLVRTDASGTLLWDKTVGGSGEDGMLDVAVSPPGRVVLAGYSKSNVSGEKTQPSRGDADYWIVALDELPTAVASRLGLTFLGQNYPNPFNPTTTIAFSIAKPGHVELTIFDVRGARVRTLVDQDRTPNHYRVNWDGTNNADVPVASGIYFYRLRTLGFEATRKMILLK